MPFQFRKEAIEEDLNSNFPSQGQGNPPLYYSLSEVVVPTYSINSVAEGSGLPQNLQTAWDFSTGQAVQVGAGTTAAISNTGFWKVGIHAEVDFATAGVNQAELRIFDGVTEAAIWIAQDRTSNPNENFLVNDEIVVFLRSGDTLRAICTAGASLFVNYRQIATLNGTLVNPLGFSFA